MFGDSQVRTGHLIVGFLNGELRHKFLAISKELAKIKLESLTDNFSKIVSGSPEDSLRASDGSGLSAGAAPGRNQRRHPACGNGQTGGAQAFHGGPD
jgi:type VI secretion system protein VasG